MGEDCDWVGTLLLQRPGLCIKQRHAGGKTHGTGDTATEAVPGCGSVGSVVYLLSICHLFFSLFYHSSPPFQMGSFASLLYGLLVFPHFSMKSLILSLDPSHRTQINCLGGRRKMRFLVLFDAFVSNEA